MQAGNRTANDQKRNLDNARSRILEQIPRSWVQSALIVGLFVSSVFAAQQKESRESESNSAASPSNPKPAIESQDEKLGGASRGEEGVSDAERIARLQRAIAENEKLLVEYRAKLNDPQAEYANAETEFLELDGKFQAKRRELQKQKDAGLTDPVSVESELAVLEPQRKLAKERFDLAIKARKTLHEQIANLELNLQKDLEAFKKLTEVKVAPTAEPKVPQVGPSLRPSEISASPDQRPTARGVLKPDSALESQRPSEPVAIPQSPSPAVSNSKPASATTGPSGALPTSGGSTLTILSPQLVHAQEEASKKAGEAAEAAREAQSVSERIEGLKKSIELERTQLHNVRQRADNSQESERTLDEEMQRRWAEGAEWAELEELRQKVSGFRQRFHAARAEIKDRTDRLDSLLSELTTLQSEELVVLRDADATRVAAEHAQKKVEQLQNPYAPHNVLQWIINHAPRILVILLSMAAIVWIARLLERRILGWMTHHGKGGTAEDENRAQTLVGVFHNAIRVVVVLGGSLMILAEVGVNIIPLMGGAAVLGLAAAFGGQNLLRDYFSGFMILLENQYVVNDVIRVGDISGMVERVTLRLTVLRDLDGRVHFVPNGHITAVSNLTHGWSRALFEIGVAYKENVDQIMDLLVEMGKELRRDPAFRHMILEQPEMLGVDQFSDSAIIIKFYIKTRPLMQWTVKREMLRRIKGKFDELGIELPFSHRTLYHRYPTDRDRDDSNTPIAQAYGDRTDR